MMDRKPNILAFAGSTREASLNKRLVRVAAKGAEDAGATVLTIDLRDYPLPLYDEDLRETDGEPDTCRHLKGKMKNCDGFIIASPEYNSSIPGVLKNMIDWVSRPADGEAPLECFRGKTAVIMSISPGGLGGLRGLIPLRMLLENMGVLVLPGQRAIPNGMSAFEADGSMADPELEATVKQLGATLSEFLVRQG